MSFVRLGTDARRYIGYDPTVRLIQESSAANVASKRRRRMDLWPGAVSLYLGPRSARVEQHQHMYVLHVFSDFSDYRNLIRITNPHVKTAGPKKGQEQKVTPGWELRRIREEMSFEEVPQQEKLTDLAQG